MKHTRWTAAAGIALGLLLALSMAACGPEMATSVPEAEATATEEPAAEPATGVSDAIDEDAATVTDELQYIEVEAGDGPAPQVGDVVAVHYRGTLEDGTEFDNSYDRGEPVTFPLGRGRVIPGWEQGIALMHVGGKAKLIIPPELAYGESGAGGVIPPNATLTFEVELVSILSGAPEAPSDVDEED